MGISEKIQRIIKKILKYISRMFSKTPKRKFYFGMFYKHCKVKDNVILVESFHGSNISDSTLVFRTLRPTTNFTRSGISC